MKNWPVKLNGQFIDGANECVCANVRVAEIEREILVYCVCEREKESESEREKVCVSVCVKKKERVFGIQWKGDIKRKRDWDRMKKR